MVRRPNPQNHGQANGRTLHGGGKSGPFGTGPHTVAHSNCVKKFVDSNMSEALSTMIAVGQCIFFAMHIDCEARRATFDQDSENSCSSAVGMTLSGINILFIVVSLIEWALRLYTFGFAVFQDPTYIVDTFCVWVFGIGFTLLLMMLPNEDDKSPYRWLQSLQILRIVRILRGVKLVGQNQNFNALWLLIRGMVSSIRTLISGAILFLTTVYVFAVLGTGLIGHSNKSGWDEPIALAHAERFDSVFTSILSLIRIFFADGAFDFMISIGRQMPFVHIYFGLFIGLAVFVVSNLIVAVIVENALHITAKDEAVKANARTNAKRELMRRLFDIFQELDKEGNGIITFEEFINSFRVEQMRYMLQSLDFDEKDLIELFKTLDDDNSGSLNLEEFMIRMSRLTEDPTAKDYLSLQKLSHSCIDLAKMVATTQKSLMAGQEGHFEESGKKIIKLSADMSFIHQQLEHIKPQWIHRVTNYGPPP